MIDISRTQLESLIDEWIIGKNAARDRMILKERLIDGVCYEPLAERHEMPVSQVKRIIYKRQNQLFKHLK